jgi:rhodanese-related sulfurtransferase
MKRPELVQRIQSKNAPVIVDPRSPFEFGRGHIPGAVNAPVWKILFRSAPIPEERNTEMVIGCMHGQRAWLAEKALSFQGYRNMTFLDGWLQEWVKDGLPWVKER